MNRNVVKFCSVFKFFYPERVKTNLWNKQNQFSCEYKNAMLFRFYFCLVCKTTKRMLTLFLQHCLSGISRFDLLTETMSPHLSVFSAFFFLKHKSMLFM